MKQHILIEISNAQVQATYNFISSKSQTEEAYLYAFNLFQNNKLHNSLINDIPVQNTENVIETQISEEHNNEISDAHIQHIEVLQHNVTEKTSEQETSKIRILENVDKLQYHEKTSEQKAPEIHIVEENNKELNATQVHQHNRNGPHSSIAATRYDRGMLE